jgi:hypothetical protein
MSTITLPYDINNGDTLDADKVMANENAIVTEYNASVGGQGGDVLTTTNTKTASNKTFTSPVLNTGVSGTAIDTDSTLAANSDTLLPSQKAVKAAIAAKVINRGFSWYLDGTWTTADEVGAKYISPQAMTAVRISAKTTSGTATIRIQKNTTDIANSISVTSTTGHTTSFSSASIAQFDVITLDITADSSCVGLTVVMECTQP